MSDVVAPVIDAVSRLGCEPEIPVRSSKQSLFIHRARDSFAKAMEFDLTKVRERFQKDYGIPRKLSEQYELETIKYLVLSSTNLETVYGMRGSVDDYWHTFLLFTLEYHEFFSFINGRFVHHVPDTADYAATASGESTSLDQYKCPSTNILNRANRL